VIPEVYSLLHWVVLRRALLLHLVNLFEYAIPGDLEHLLTGLCGGFVDLFQAGKNVYFSIDLVDPRSQNVVLDLKGFDTGEDLTENARYLGRVCHVEDSRK
jgi:hypothetical protein